MLHSSKFKTILSENGVTSTEIHHDLRSVGKLAANYLRNYFYTFNRMDARIKVQKGPTREYSRDDFLALISFYARTEYYTDSAREVHIDKCGPQQFYVHLDSLVCRYAGIRSCAKPEK
jgi:hypothetical protein